MTASQGVELFLLRPARARQLSVGAAEEAIEIASTYEPNSAINRAEQWWRANESANPMGALGYGKGVRWLAILRRDGEMEKFTATCRQLLLLTRLP